MCVCVCVFVRGGMRVFVYVIVPYFEYFMYFILDGLLLLESGGCPMGSRIAHSLQTPGSDADDVALLPAG